MPAEWEPDAEALEIWAMLSRVEPMTQEALQGRRPLAATLKLDGRRVVLQAKEGLVRILSSQGWERLQLEARGDCLLDAEELQDQVHVFDALFVGKRDLRELPLTERLRAAAEVLPDGCALKPYYPLRSREDVVAVWRRAQASAQPCDGLIFVSLVQGYRQPPLKFKRRVSFDFALENPLPGKGYVLLATHAGQLVPFRWKGRPCFAAPRGVLAKLPGKAHRRRALVVEFELAGDKWEPLRLRPDRSAPNGLATLRRNLELIARGEHSAGWMLRAVPPTDAREAFACWLEAQRRLILEAVGTAVSTRELLHPLLGEPARRATSVSERSEVVAVFALPAALDALLLEKPTAPRMALLCPGGEEGATEEHAWLLGDGSRKGSCGSLEQRLQALGYTTKAQAPPSAPDNELLALPPPLLRLAMGAALLLAHMGEVKY